MKKKTHIHQTLSDANRSLCCLRTFEFVSFLSRVFPPPHSFEKGVLWSKQAQRSWTMHARTLEPLEGACYTQLTVIDSKIDVRKIQPLPTAAGVKWKHNRSIVAHTCFFHLHRETQNILFCATTIAVSSSLECLIVRRHPLAHAVRALLFHDACEVTAPV